MTYDKDTIYSINVNEWKKSFGINKCIIEKIGNKKWKPHSINVMGAVDSIELVDTGEIITPSIISDSIFKDNNYCLFTISELEHKKVIVVQQPREFMIAYKAYPMNDFSIIKGNHDNLFTIDEVNSFVNSFSDISDLFEKNCKPEVRIFKLYKE